MVRLRGMPRPGPPGRGMGRPMPMHMRPEPIMPPFGMHRGRPFRGHPVRPGPPRLPPPRMGPAPPPPPGLGLPPPLGLPPRRLPLPHRPPLPPRDLPPPMGRRPLPPPPMLHRPGVRMPPLPMAPMPPLRRPPPMHPGQPFVRGRGGVARRGVKRLGPTANGRAKKNPKRKEKTEGEFFCEACDRTFKSQELLDAHVAEHVVCGRDGCVFTAHPKVVDKHVKLQHDTGLYKSIVFSQSPEEVAKWIAARKSRYPTKVNVERKEAQQSEMIQRGERMPTEGNSRHKRHDSWQDRKKRRRNQNKNNVDGNRQKQRDKHVTNNETKWKDPDAWRGDLPKFPGTGAFLVVNDEPMGVGEEKHISDDESEPNTMQDVAVSKPLFSSVLASLMMNYGSDTDDECKDNVPAAPTVSKNETNRPIFNQQGLPCDSFLRLKADVIKPEKDDSDSGPEETGIIKSEEITQEKDNPESGPEETVIHREDTTNAPIPKLNTQTDRPQEDKTVKSKNEAVKTITRPKPPVRPPMKRIQLSLLEKLLQNEIRHERTAILQCVRYVVNNNFFGCGSKS
ncbi:FMR1-interacting protein NUFIP1-like [Macrosteles quadrilineatus]|uniref:FMR1-interacting protein NUFIP1-like n=1 Tax=Macrosteles quadrilineatus TaxID=74068 RepID=UPI0023E0E892|nr:FMR1-interacting protein NUFIP1-like [Macrosteles quadrilineatus]